LAVPPQAEALAVDLDSLLKLTEYGKGVVDLVVDRNILAATVEPRDSDASRRQHLRKVAEQEMVFRAIVGGRNAMIAGKDPRPVGRSTVPLAPAQDDAGLS
jgi:hypothetical protein